MNTFYVQEAILKIVKYGKMRKIPSLSSSRISTKIIVRPGGLRSDD